MSLGKLILAEVRHGARRAHGHFRAGEADEGPAARAEDRHAARQPPREVRHRLGPTTNWCAKP